MPRLGRTNLNQKAVLWKAAGYDSYGEPTLDAPQEIDCRWDQDRRENVSDQGTPIAIDATAVVEIDIPIGSIMRQGALEDLPDTLDSLFKVVSFSSVPDIKGRVFVRDVSMQRYSESLPGTVGTEHEE